MLFIIATYYLFISLTMFTLWLRVFLADSSTKKTDIISWIALIIGSTLWPLVLPFAYLELNSKRTKQKQG